MGQDHEQGKAREPKILSSLPVSTGVYAVCIVHLVLCILILSFIVVGTPLNLEGVLVSPLLQWIYGAFTLLSIVTIICAGVGALYHIESHLNVYASILLISTIIDIFIFALFLIYGQSCSRQHVRAQYHVASTVYCAARDGMVLLCLTLLVLFKLVAVYVVNKCRSFVRSAYNLAMVPFIQAHLASVEKEAANEEESLPPQDWAWNSMGPGAYPTMAPMPSMAPMSGYGAMSPMPFQTMSSMSGYGAM